MRHGPILAKRLHRRGGRLRPVLGRMANAPDGTMTGAMRSRIVLGGVLFGIALLAGAWMLAGVTRRASTPTVVAAPPDRERPFPAPVDLAPLPERTRPPVPTPTPHDDDAGDLEIRGTVVDAAGGSRSITVGLFDVPTRGALQRWDEASCGRGGTFFLVAPGSGRFVVVALAPGCRPATRVVELEPGRPAESIELRLDAGLAISGRAVVNGHAPARGSRVIARLDPGPRLFLGGVAAYWNGASFELRTVAEACDDFGHFRLGGLGPFEYELDAAVSRAPEGSVDLHLASSRNVLRATAPATDLTIAI